MVVTLDGGLLAGPRNSTEGESRHAKHEGLLNLYFLYLSYVKCYVKLVMG